MMLGYPDIFSIFCDVGDRWLLWKNIVRAGKPTKVPFNIISALPASSTDPDTWGAFLDAMGVMEEELTKDDWNGLGVVLGEIEDGLWLVGIDLDACINADGVLTVWAEDILEACPTYAEVSPSGTGLKLFGYVRGTKPGTKTITFADDPTIYSQHKPKAEMRSHSRFFTVTGEHWGGSPRQICDITDGWFGVVNMHGGVDPERTKTEFDASGIVPESDELPASVKALFEREPDLAERFWAGERLSQGNGDDSGSGKDWNMALTLTHKGISREDACTCLWLYSGGQFGEGAKNQVTGDDAVRRAGRIAGDLPEPKLAAEDVFDPDLEAQEEQEPQPDYHFDWREHLAKEVGKLNKELFTVRLGGKFRAARVEHDEQLDREYLTYIQKDDLLFEYQNPRLQIGEKPVVNGTVPIMGTIGQGWIAHPERRGYKKVKLLPGIDAGPDVYNLWRGFGVEPKEGTWDTIRAHLLDVVCSGNQAHYDYMIGWMAYCVQKPARQAEVALVLRGEKGVGKGAVGTILKRFFQHNTLHISNARRLVGRFNAHLENVLFLFADEAFYAGDKSAEGDLKALITEAEITIEPKGIDSYRAPNMLKILMCSNSDWVIPTSADERRYFVLDVPSDKKDDTEYFARLFDAIRGDELAAMLHDLLAMDLSGWCHRSPPHTEALNDQKMLGADSFASFWRDCLAEGVVAGIGKDEWPDLVPRQQMHEAYKKYANARGDRYPVVAEWMGRKLRKLSPGIDIVDKRAPATGNVLGRPWCYALGCLKKHRDAYALAMKIDPAEMFWNEEEENS